MKRFRILDHTADIGLVIYGTDLKSLFEHAGEGFFHLITDLRKVRPRVEKKMTLHGKGLERLMVSWLTELLYYHDVENLLFRKFKVTSVREGELRAVAFGEHFREGVHVIKTEVKAVTYHHIQVQKENRMWRAQMILDL